MEIQVATVMFCFLLAAHLVDVSHAVKCYSCDSLLSTDKACEDPFSSDGVSTKECSGGCSKSKVESDDNQIISRGCAGATVNDDDCHKQSGTTGEVNVCLCKGELCNSATTSEISVALFMFTIIGRMLHRWII